MLIFRLLSKLVRILLALAAVQERCRGYLGRGNVINCTHFWAAGTGVDERGEGGGDVPALQFDSLAEVL